MLLLVSCALKMDVALRITV